MDGGFFETGEKIKTSSLGGVVREVELEDRDAGEKSLYVAKVVKQRGSVVPGEVFLAELVMIADKPITRESHHVVFPIEAKPEKKKDGSIKEYRLIYPRLSGDLYDYIKNSGNSRIDRPPLMPFEDIVRFTTQIGKAYDTIHKILHVTHRDGTPSNFLVDDKGNFFLADFEHLRRIDDLSNNEVLADRLGFLRMMRWLLTSRDHSDLDYFLYAFKSNSALRRLKSKHKEIDIVGLENLFKKFADESTMTFSEFANHFKKICADGFNL